MAKINKKKQVSMMEGLPTKEALLTAPENVDTIPAQINNADGSTTPAALTQGEFVFSLPAIIALGEGNYDKGVTMLDSMHKELQAIGDMMLAEQGLGSVPPT